ncbi:MAG: hypothetical protein L0Y72_15290 [Gemmataceae bacterium]|nr:hypothetical protein [Gemmataceae bacterium]MCI0740409.1 hypothetical protein [Gemmataceae bacterium]
MNVQSARTYLLTQDETDSQVVARLVVKYYDWLTDNGGMSPEELLAIPLSQHQRKVLLKHMDDVLEIYGLTARMGPAGR